MTLKESIRSSLKEAMKSGDSSRRDVLRMLESSIQKTEIEKKKREEGLSDEEVVALVAQGIKQRRDSAAQYKEAGRAELAEKEEQEITFLEEFLPEQLSAAEVEAKVAQAIETVGAASANDLGRVMGVVMPELKGRADGALIRSVAQKLLS